ncbi:MAG: uncharacterized protein QOD38_550 [Acidimicrobiaceae bacterium]|jgi:uncharacterized protein YceH (UPF0502 family)
MIELDLEEVRVLGCLLEKERTVPDSYPMTLNGLVTACNQSSNRWPVVAYDAGTVQRTVDGLKDAGLVRFVHPSHGERTTKFRQVVDERLALLPTEAAVLCVLFVRGPQTVAEIRTRTERLHAFDSPEEVETTLRGLADRDQPLVERVDRRWTHTFAQAEITAVSDSAPASKSALDERIGALEAKVEHLYAILGEPPPPS